MIFIVLLIMESPLTHDDDWDENLLHIGCYIIAILLAAFYFLTCGENPGWVKLPESELTTLEKRNLSTRYHPPGINEKSKGNTDNNEGLHSFQTNSLESNEEDKGIEISDFGEKIHLEFANRNIDIQNPNNLSESNDSFLEDNAFYSMPPKHFCKICNIEQEYRTRHCHKCGKCVYKYDHHCFWIGQFF